MVWIAEVSRCRSIPVDQIHVALYGYFPQIAPGADRPYVWRFLDMETLLLASMLRPAARTAREIMPAACTTYDFHLTFKRVRNVRGSYRDENGERHARRHRSIEMQDRDEIKRWLRDFAARRGADIRYVRVENLRVFRPLPHVRLPICDAVGKLFVTDAAAFAQLIACGGPGTGKVYGLGMWYLPELMETRRDAA